MPIGGQPANSIAEKNKIIVHTDYVVIDVFFLIDM